jgi:hypothetical protein
MKNLQNQPLILLIENNSDWLIGVCSELEAAGCDVLIATGGDEGFCAARRRQPDLILCETALPDISGVQLCYMVRADEDLHDTPFVLIGETNGENGNASCEGFQAGADDFFEKNCQPQFLTAKIRRLIALQRSEAELRQRRSDLHRSEMYLTKIIEDASNLVTVLNPAAASATFENYDNSKPHIFSGKSTPPQKHLPSKNADALQVWNRALETKEIVEINKFSNRGKREKVIYEIVR